VADSELAKQLLVVATRVGHLGGRRDDADPRAFAPADIDEAIENLGIVKLLLGSADRNDVTTPCVPGRF